MSELLAPNTNIAVLQASQNELGRATRAAQVAAQSKDLEAATAVAKEFEAVFVSEMLKPMFEGISTEAPFGGGKGEEIFQGMLLQEYGKIVSQTGSVGLSDSVRDQIIQLQGQADSIAQKGVANDE